MIISEALPVSLAMREIYSDFEVRERWGYTTREDSGMDCRGRSIPQRGTTGCKGSQLSHRGNHTGNKEVQLIANQSPDQRGWRKVAAGME